MANLKIVLDTRRQKNNGKYPIVFRLTHAGQSRTLRTDFSIFQSDWNPRTERVKDSLQNSDIINEQLARLRAQYLAKTYAFINTNPQKVSAQSIRLHLLSKEVSEQTVYSFWHDHIANLKKGGYHGNARNHLFSLNVLNKITNLKIPFTAIDFKFLQNIEFTLKNQGVKINSISVYLRTLRAVFNLAINHKVINRDSYPFATYRIKSEKTAPRPITKEEMKTYFQFSPNSKHRKSYLLGKLIFLLIGINFKDLVLLNHNNIINGYVYYRRAKTGKPYTIKLLPEAKSIIAEIGSNSESSLLGILTDADLANPETLPKIILQRNKVFNAHLSKIGDLLGFQEKLTGYVFRYTWSNIAKQLGYSKDLISEALGHEYGNKVTGLYLENYDEEVIDEMNKSVINSVM